MNEQLAVRVTTNVQRRYALLRRGARRLLRRIDWLEVENDGLREYIAMLEGDNAALEACLNRLENRIMDLEDSIKHRNDLYRPAGTEEVQP